ncbi:DNA polymerase [Propionispora sp. 2/2-37]|uniref:DNA polymerase n=1 Tax=Propionispora sp. 2/2-37 TaxID=1677858 RepID=UPI0006BB677E|nr:DNA polymerase [Propionispora sp. 2/2-37]CUH95904.1 DNA polymerase [Propionispora sp. 2/2-37]
MTMLSIDLETFSTLDIKKVGAYKYAESCEILLFGFAFDDDPVTVIELVNGQEIPREVRKALWDTRIPKTAYNAQFERVVLSNYFTAENYMDGDPTELWMTAEDWYCTMVHGLYLGMPGNLDQLSKVLFPDSIDKQKMTEGKALIKYFCTPCKPTKTNGQRTRNMPQHDPEKWAKFVDYNRRDVEVERNARKILEKIPLPEMERRLYRLDQDINDRGVMVDMGLVKNAMECDELNKAEMEAEAIRLTGLDNPNSVSQLKEWLQEAEGVKIESLNKETVPELLANTESETVKRVLELRQQMAKTSVKKYQAMECAVCHDGRVRGLLQFYGANRTGRWAGRLVQVQNLPQNKLSDLDLAREMLIIHMFSMIQMLYGNTQDILSQLIRTAFIAAPGKRFIISDFSAIEARVIAWLAGESWRLNVFKTHGKIYEASAAAMFKVPVESIDKHNPLRQKGKVAELALGYQGGPNALIKMGALKQGLTEEELPALVKMWRNASPHIVQLWQDAENAAKEAVQNRTSVQLKRGVSYKYEKGILFAVLPSGRQLAYVKPRVEMAETNVGVKEQLSYEGQDQTTKQWKRMPTYGGKLVENLVQAIARDCLAVAMDRLDQANYEIVMHVHDEIITEMPKGYGSLDEMNKILAQPIGWAPGLPLKGDGFETLFYKKDD